jgi:hypothetical protein
MSPFLGISPIHSFFRAHEVSIGGEIRLEEARERHVIRVRFAGGFGGALYVRNHWGKTPWGKLDSLREMAGPSVRSMERALKADLGVILTRRLLVRR